MKTTGYSLLEIVITLGLLSLLVLPISRMFSSHNQESLFQGQQVRALALAQSAIESFSGWDDLSPLDVTGNARVTTGNETTLSIGVAYVNNVDTANAVSRVISPTPTDFKLVSVNVAFGAGYSLSLVRIFANDYNP